MAVARITKLDAVNQLLRGIGKAPANTLEGPTSRWTRLAEDQVDETSRTVQLEGWGFNTQYDYILSVQAETGFITAPPNVARFQVKNEPWIILRGERLYDRKEQTFVFERAVEGMALLVFEFDELPESAKDYIAAKGARVMFETHVQDQAPQAITEKEVRTRATLTDRDTNEANFSMLDDEYTFPRLYGSSYVPGSPDLGYRGDRF